MVPQGKMVKHLADWSFSFISTRTLRQASPVRRLASTNVRRLSNDRKTPEAQRQPSVHSAQFQESLRRQMAETAVGRAPPVVQAEAVSTTSPKSSSSSLLWKVIALGGCGAALYALTRPLSEEPKHIGELPWYSRQLRRMIAHFNVMMKSIRDPQVEVLLPEPFPPGHPGYRPYTVVLELDDVLVHSEWSPKHGWTIKKRPFVDQFLAYLADRYELILFTRRPDFYAAPITDKLDSALQVFRYRLYDNATLLDPYTADAIKDLGMLNRDLSRVILMDLKPQLSQQPDNVIEVPAWEGDPNDTWLLDVLTFMDLLQSSQADVRQILPHYRGLDIPKETAKRIQAAKMVSQAPTGGSAGEAQGDNVWGKIGKFLLSFVTYQGPPAGMTDLGGVGVARGVDDLTHRQAMQIAELTERLEEHQRLVESEMKMNEEVQQTMMEKMKGDS